MVAMRLSFSSILWPTAKDEAFMVLETHEVEHVVQSASFGRTGMSAGELTPWYIDDLEDARVRAWSSRA